MFLTRRRHSIRQPRRLRIIAAHQALQLSKLIDHFGLQIGLRHPRGQGRLFSVGPDERRNLTRQRFDPLDPVALAAQFVVERHV